jgi:branched-chain amino acid transport system substrate-binding protein
MKHQLMLKLVAPLLLISILAAACSPAVIKPPTATAPATRVPLPAEITLAAVEDLTGRNDIYGKPIKMGIDLAVKQINEQKTLGAGVTLKVEYTDTASDTDQAVAAFKKLVDDPKITAILGPTISTQGQAADPLAQKAGMPVVASSNTANGITTIGDYIFRTSLPDSAVIPNTVSVVAKGFHLAKVAILYGTDDAFTTSAEKIFKTALTNKKIDILTEETFKLGDTDFSAQLTKIKALNPDAIIVAALSDEAAKIMIQARAMGIPASVPFLGGNSFNSLKVPQAAGAAGEGAISGSAWSLHNTNPSSVKFVEAFKAEYKSDPDQFAAQAYTAVWVVALAIKRAHSVDHATVRDALASTETIASPLGLFSFDQNRDPIHKPVVLIVKDGKFDVYQP